VDKCTLEASSKEDWGCAETAEKMSGQTTQLRGINTQYE
jgi:hypothetical protein